MVVVIPNRPFRSQSYGGEYHQAHMQQSGSYDALDQFVGHENGDGVMGVSPDYHGEQAGSPGSGFNHDGFHQTRARSNTSPFNATAGSGFGPGSGRLPLSPLAPGGGSSSSASASGADQNSTEKVAMRHRLGGKAGVLARQLSGKLREDIPMRDFTRSSPVHFNHTATAGYNGEHDYEGIDQGLEGTGLPQESAGFSPSRSRVGSLTHAGATMTGSSPSGRR